MIEKHISDIIEGEDKVDFYIAIIAALSKQLPYKPTSNEGKCLCGAFLDPSTKYCGHCGQKLDWSDQK